jgi:DNA mismatch endonuclease (patch repair protein)
MDSWATSEGTRRSMQSNRPRDTKPERLLRSELHRRGYRFRKHVRPVAGLRCEPDIVFPRLRLAVFLDGCWWHCCPTHSSVAKTHADFWSDKMASTRARDERNNVALRAAGWTVLRIWEHVPPTTAATQVAQMLRELETASESHT